MMQVSKRIPFDNPDVLLGVRGLYIGTNILIGVMYFLVGQKINKKKGMRAFLTIGSSVR
jgi:hypothetical protein